MHRLRFSEIMVGKVEKVYTRFQLVKLFQPIQGGMMDKTFDVPQTAKEVSTEHFSRYVYEDAFQ